MHPKARTDSLIVQDMDGETLVYDRKTGKAHCLNSTAAIVWRHCDGKMTVRQIARLLASETKVPADETMVWLALDGLEKSKLLEGPVPRPAEVAMISRRELARRISVLGGIAIALPVVTSIFAPTAQAAGSCLQKNGNCAPSGICTSPTNNCCSPLICQGSPCKCL